MSADSITWVMGALVGGCKWEKYSVSTEYTVWAGYVSLHLHSVVVILNAPQRIQERQVPIELRNLHLTSRNDERFLSCFGVPQIKHLVATQGTKQYKALRVKYHAMFQMWAEMLDRNPTLRGYGHDCCDRILQLLADTYKVKLNCYLTPAIIDQARFVWHFHNHHGYSGINVSLVDQDGWTVDIRDAEVNTSSELAQLMLDQNLKPNIKFSII